MTTNPERDEQRIEEGDITRAGIPDTDRRDDVAQPREVSLNPLLADQGAGLDRLNVHYEAATTQPMVGEQTDPASLSPEEQAVRDEFRVLFLRAFGQLPLEQRQALLLHTRDGLSIEEVARQEGVSAGDARGRIEAAEKALRESVGRQYEDIELPENEIMYEAFEDISLDDQTLNELTQRVSGRQPRERST